MIHKNSAIGIWGFGVVGQSAFIFLRAQGAQEFHILDSRPIHHFDAHLLTNNRVIFYQQIDQKSIETFLEKLDYLLISPGIKIDHYNLTFPPLLHEIDLFAQHWQGSIIAITGTIGKTTTTALLHALLQQKNSATMGGNIGIGMLDLLMQPHDVKTIAVLELSSFQLEHATQLRPDIAIITNLYPNHIDRHTTYQRYIQAKCNIFLHQYPHQHLVLPLQTAVMLDPFYDLSKHQLHLITTEPPPSTIPLSCSWQSITYEDNQSIMHIKNDSSKPVSIPKKYLVPTTYTHNWMLVHAAAQILNPSDNNSELVTSEVVQSLLEHRLEKVAVIHGVEYYNDSKSTIMESTLSAVQALADKPIILLLGGISKGVDRTTAIASLSNQVKAVICFGGEAHILQEACQAAAIPTTACSDLPNALRAAQRQACRGDRIVFSPGGASFDLFSNYKERGIFFKKLIMCAPQ